MAIHSLKLKNFKCFKEVDIDFGKITLLTGANSSGKSSLINSLLAIFQTQDFPFYYSLNGKYVNMGDFGEVVFKHDKNVDIEIDVVIADRSNRPINYHTVWTKDSTTLLCVLKSLYVESSWFKIDVNKSKKYLVNFSSLNKEGLDPDIIISMNDIMMFLELNQHKTKPLSEDQTNDKIIDREFESLDEVIASNFSIFTAAKEFEFIDADLNYISSFRHNPERTYYQKAKVPSKIDTSGEGYIDQIIEWQNNTPAKSKALNRIMKQLSLAHSIQAKNLKAGRFELRVKTSSKSVASSLTDVGFGISQFLPIIVADLQLSDDSLLMMSQPEIHLHPSVQALLGNYLAEQVNKTNKRYLVETHSEYLINRIRLLIVQKKLSPQDVSIYYLQNSPDGSKAHKIEFTPEGQILNAPKEFFDTYMIDVMDIALSI